MISIKLLKDWGMWGFLAVNFRCLMKPTFSTLRGSQYREVCNIGCFCNLYCFTISVSLCGLLLNNCSVFIKSKKDFMTISILTLDPGIAVFNILTLLMCLRFVVRTCCEISTSSASASENLNTEPSESFWFLRPVLQVQCQHGIWSHHKFVWWFDFYSLLALLAVNQVL